MPTGTRPTRAGLDARQCIRIHSLEQTASHERTSHAVGRDRVQAVRRSGRLHPRGDRPDLGQPRDRPHLRELRARRHRARLVRHLGRRRGGGAGEPDAHLGDAGPRRPGRGRGVGGSAATTRSSARTSCSRSTPAPTSSAAPSPTASTAAAGWSRSGWCATSSRSACSSGRTPTRSPGRKPFIGYSGSMLTPPPANVLAVGDSGERPDDYRAEAQMVLEFIEQVWNGRDLQRGRAVLGARPDPAHDRLPHDHPARGLPARAAARCSGRSRAGASRSATCRRTTPSSYAGLRVAVTWVYKGDYNGTADFGPLTGSPGRDPRRLAVPRAGRPAGPRGARLRRDRRPQPDPRPPRRQSSSPARNIY